MWSDKLISLLPRATRRKGLLILMSIPVRALLDLVGVAVLLPVLILVLDSGRMADIPFFQGEHAVIILVLSILAIVIFKSVFNVFLLYRQNKYLLSIYKFFSVRLFSKLYDKGLFYVKNSNTSDIAYNVNVMCYYFALGFLSSVMKFSGEVLFCILMLVALFIYNPMASLLMVVAFLPIVYIYVRVVLVRLKLYGKAEMKARREQQKVVTETFKGYAEMEVNQAFPFMMKRFGSGLEEIFHYKKKSMLIQSIPQYFLEIGVVLVVCAMVLFSVNAQRADMRVFLGIFTVVMIRMLPVVHSLINTWSGIKSSEFTLEILDEVADCSGKDICRPESSDKLRFEEAVRVQHLSFSYPTGRVLEDLSFEIPKGITFGIQGKTGAGKSTLFNLLLGLLEPESGSIEVDGQPLVGENIHRWHNIVGYVPQEVFIADLSLAENIALGHESIDREKLARVIRQASLEEFVSSLPEGMDTFIGEGGSRISGGQRQRIGIARALYKDAEVLFFDEATSSLDNATEQEINASIRKLSDEDRRLTIVIISHRQSSLAFCDKIIQV